jgi:hypothetical protein
MWQTITASMEKDEMNYTLRQHSLGQNKGRYDYLFNFIKRLTLPKSKQVSLPHMVTSPSYQPTRAASPHVRWSSSGALWRRATATWWLRISSSCCPTTATRPWAPPSSRPTPTTPRKSTCAAASTR